MFRLHAPATAHVDMDAMAELAEALLDAGKIRAFGIAVERASDAAPWLVVEHLSSIQLPFRLLDRAAASVVQRAHERNVSVVARGVLGAGALVKQHSDRSITPAAADNSLIADIRMLAERRAISVTQLAIAVAAARPGIDVVLVGVRLRRHLNDLLEANTFATPDEELLAEIDEILATHDR